MEISLKRLVEAKEGPVPQGLLALDPGETTGWAFFKDGEFVEAGQFTGNRNFEELKSKFNPDVVVFEEFRLFPWKAKQLSFNTLPAAQKIGIILYIFKDCFLFKQSPSQVKFFFDDERLKSLDLWPKGVKHGRDAIRHGAYYLVFNKGKESNCNEQFD